MAVIETAPAMLASKFEFGMGSTVVHSERILPIKGLAGAQATVNLWLSRIVNRVLVPGQLIRP